MIILEPIEPHASLAEDDVCRAHDRGSDLFGWDHDAFAHETAIAQPRVWRMTGDGAEATRIGTRQPLADLRNPQRPPQGIVLETGTRLRLDSTTSERHYDGGDHTSITRRFCVLDGPHAGTCWESSESIATDDSWRLGDPVEPLDKPA